MRVLLTGATGFIGKHVLARLLANHCSVNVLVVPETLERLIHHSQVTAVPGGLDDQRALMRAAKGAEVVFHVAGKVLGQSLPELIEVNVQGTGNLLAVCAANNVRRFVFVSSASVYRFPLSLAGLPITETCPLGPIGNSPFRDYGHSKIHAERLVLQFSQIHGLEYSILRPTTAYGPGQAITHQSMETLLLKILSDAGWAFVGSQPRIKMQWVHVLDLAKAIVHAGLIPGAKNQIFTIAGAELFTFPTLMALLRDILRPAAPITIPGRSSHLTRYPYLIYDITKARKMLGYEPGIDLHTGLSQMVEDMQRNGRFPLGFETG